MQPSLVPSLSVVSHAVTAWCNCSTELLCRVCTYIRIAAWNDWQSYVALVKSPLLILHDTGYTDYGIVGDVWHPFSQSHNTCWKYLWDYTIRRNFKNCNNSILQNISSYSTLPKWVNYVSRVTNSLASLRLSTTRSIPAHLLATCMDRAVPSQTGLSLYIEYESTKACSARMGTRERFHKEKDYDTHRTTPFQHAS